jgi:hypothetical protein
MNTIMHMYQQPDREQRIIMAMMDADHTSLPRAAYLATVPDDIRDDVAAALAYGDEVELEIDWDAPLTPEEQALADRVEERLGHKLMGRLGRN